MKTNNIRKSKPKAKTPKLQHHFVMREVVLKDVVANSVQNVDTDTSGFSSGAMCLSSLGLRSLNVTSTTPFLFENYVVDLPHLRFLANQAKNFSSYRVSRAKIIFVGSVSATTFGTITLAGYSDVLDASNTMQTAYMVGRHTKSFDLASSQVREISLALPVDSSWKKVTDKLCVGSNTIPFSGLQNTIVPVNSVSDLCFGAFTWTVIGSSLTNKSVGSFHLDYEVEFKDPISSVINV